MRFDFPLLLTEVLRHECNAFQLAECRYADSLHLARAAADLGVVDGRARLQCLGRSCCCSCARAHRALEDTLALRNVVHHFADRLGVGVAVLLRPFVHEFDVVATLVDRTLLP